MILRRPSRMNPNRKSVTHSLMERRSSYMVRPMPRPIKEDILEGSDKQ